MIQIYGAGMAGSYLYHLLAKNGFDVRIYDKRNRPDCRCAWGTVYSEAREYYSEIEVNFEYTAPREEWTRFRDWDIKEGCIRLLQKAKG